MLPISKLKKTDIKGFKRFLDKYGIDYAITKDPSQTPLRYLVFFKARDGDAMTAAFKGILRFSAAKAKETERAQAAEQTEAVGGFHACEGTAEETGA